MTKPHEIPGLGKARLAALVWFSKHGPAHLFGPEDPSLVMVKWLENAGLVARIGSVRAKGVLTPFAFSQYDLSDAGRAVLKNK